jgi:molecular chaperone DnaK (HSP70)
VVYDLGGGTFDASLVHMSGRLHDAVSTAGLGRWGVTPSTPCWWG